MARIVSKPRPKKKKQRVRCRMCDSLIEYTQNEIERYDGTDYLGGPDGYVRVKCPGCSGHGYIRCW